SYIHCSNGPFPFFSSCAHAHACSYAWRSCLNPSGSSSGLTFTNFVLYAVFITSSSVVGEIPKISHIIFFSPPFCFFHDPTLRLQQKNPRSAVRFQYDLRIFPS